MTNAQFFTALCLPLIVFLVGIYFQNTGIRDLRSDMNLRFARFDQRFDDLTSKVVDIDNRLIRVEERLKL
ncbi:MAG: hypothetical protein ABSE85_15395 [Candidatus Korobacteraceae bacterium]|jgi:hypothetical protein